jgi:trans-aconitate methyltransferase
MGPLLYTELVSWYRLIDPLADHFAEAAAYRQALLAQAAVARPTLLELGAGAGNNAYYLKPAFACTLADVSAQMLALSRAINPECEHLVGDMRSLRLGRDFDAVFVHDAIMYMRTEDELAAAIATAFVHTRPGGLALFAPDCTRETFQSGEELIAGEEGERALRALEWTWDPDPSDSTYKVDFALLLREGTSVRALHDLHVEGLFPRATWLRLFESVGYQPSFIDRPIDDEHTDQIFLCRR